MRISDWSSDVCSSDLIGHAIAASRPSNIHFTKRRHINPQMDRRRRKQKSPRSLGGFLSNFRANFAAADMSGKSGFVGGQIKTPIVKGQQVDALARHVGDRKSTRLNSSH